jgi:hypothetical protein
MTVSQKLVLTSFAGKCSLWIKEKKIRGSQRLFLEIVDGRERECICMGFKGNLKHKNEMEKYRLATRNCRSWKKGWPLYHTFFAAAKEGHSPLYKINK